MKKNMTHPRIEPAVGGRSIHTSCALSLLLLIMLPALQSCGGQKPDGTDASALDTAAMRDSLDRLNDEIEALEGRRQELDRELDRLDKSVRWEVMDGKTLKPVETYIDGKNNPAGFVDALNEHWEQSGALPNPVMELKSVQGKTVYVRLQHGERLTQQMGSAGAAQYLAEATYTLTSLPNIDSVNFDFEEGDHAAPGTYGRGSWEGTFEVFEVRRP